MHLLMNGPGIPVLDLRSGKRLEAPMYSEDDLKLFATAKCVVVVDPFSNMTPEPYLSQFMKWVPVSCLNPTAQSLCILRRPGSPVADVPWWTVAEIPVLASVSDISAVKRKVSDKNISSQCVWVNKGQDRAMAELKRLCPEVLCFGDGACDIDRVGVGTPLFWCLDDAQTTLDPGPMYPEPDTATLSTLDRDKAPALIHASKPGDFRIAGLTSAMPDPGRMLKDTIQRTTSDSEFAETAEAGFAKLSTQELKDLK